MRGRLLSASFIRAPINLHVIPLGLVAFFRVAVNRAQHQFQLPEIHVQAFAQERLELFVCRPLAQLLHVHVRKQLPAGHAEVRS